MNKLIIYIITIFIGVSGTFIANKIQLKKVTKPLKKQIEKLRTDSAKSAINYKNLRTDYVNVVVNDSIKAEQVAQLQFLLQDLKRENRVLKEWKLDAEDGVILKHDTVRVGIFGKIKKKR